MLLLLVEAEETLMLKAGYFLGIRMSIYGNGNRVLAVFKTDLDDHHVKKDYGFSHIFSR